MRHSPALHLRPAGALVVPNRHGLVAVRGGGLVDWLEVDVLRTTETVGVIPDLREDRPGRAGASELQSVVAG